MFERLARHAERRAEARAEGRRSRLAERLREAAPRGVQVSVEAKFVVLAGRALGRRVVIEPELRWLVAEARDERG